MVNLLFHYSSADLRFNSCNLSHGPWPLLFANGLLKAAMVRPCPCCYAITAAYGPGNIIPTTAQGRRSWPSV